MKSLITSFLIVLLAGTSAFCQSTQSGLKFTQGQGLEVTMNLKTTIAQEAMGQSVDFNIDGLATHLFKVTNTTPDNTTLHHTMKRISYTFDGMGQKQPFDSDKPKDMEGQFGKPIRELLDKTYDMVIDSTGKVMMVLPEKIETPASDPRIMLIMNMLKDLVGTVLPPQKAGFIFLRRLYGSHQVLQHIHDQHNSRV